MAKKCIPGVVCVENMTLFLVFLILLLVIFLFFVYQRPPSTTTLLSLSPSIGLATKPTDVFSDPYFPPLQDPTIGFRRGIPRPTFSQVGILSLHTSGSREPIILPIFGKNLYSNRNKWQYYTLSNTGNISSKLPLSVHGKDGMSEYGVDEINSGDVLYVQGYNESFVATIYDSRGGISYLPYLDR
jgi:hypothetical protein